MILTQAMVAYISRLVWWHCRVALLLTLVGSTSQSSSLSTSVRTKSPSVSCRYCKQQKRIISIIFLRLLFQSLALDSSCSRNFRFTLTWPFTADRTSKYPCIWFQLAGISDLLLKVCSAVALYCWQNIKKKTLKNNSCVFDSNLQESQICYSRYVLRGLSRVDIMFKSNHWLPFKVSEQSQTATAQFSRHPRIICTVCPLASNMNMPLWHLTEPNQVYNIMISRHTFSYRDNTKLHEWLWVSFSFKLFIFPMHSNKWHLEPTDPPNQRNWGKLLSNHLPSPPPTSCRPPWPWWRCCCRGTSGARCLEQPPPSRQQWTKCGLAFNFHQACPPLLPPLLCHLLLFLQHIENKITTFKKKIIQF